MWLLQLLWLNFLKSFVIRTLIFTWTNSFEYFLYLFFKFLAGCRALQDLEVTEICVESCGDAEAAAEGSVLSTWLYQEFKDPSKRKVVPAISLFDAGSAQ